MTDVLQDIPYQDEKVGSRKLVDEKYLQLMQAALKRGQSVPRHNANSNVYILVVRGEVASTGPERKSWPRKGPWYR